MTDQLTGTGYWRSLEQLAESPENKEMIGQEFPGYDADEIATSSRRSFLKLMGASLALAGIGLNGCRRVPVEKIAPYAAGPRDRTPGIAEQYATAWELSGVGVGLLVTSYDGRPIKIEGNPSHPFAFTVPGKLASADAFAQATILDLYDPQRSRNVIDRSGGPETRKLSAWADFAKSLKSIAGKNVAILSEPCSSPTLADLRKKLTSAKWYEYEPLSRDAELEGSRLAYGQSIRPVLHLDKASVVVSIDADLLGTHPAHIRYASDWSSRRRSADQGSMNRVYIAEAGFSITGTVSDERLGTDPSRLYPVLRAIAAKLGVAGVAADDKLSEREAAFVDNAAADLTKAGPAGVIAVGPAVLPAAHALCFAVNEHLKSVGTSVTLHEDPAGNRPTHDQAISQLAADIKAGKVDALLIIGGNPAYDAPADLGFADLIAKVAWSARLGVYEDETSLKCKWHLPQAHYLESWGDVRAYDGTASIVQPLIEPLFGGKSAIEFLAMVAGDEVTAGEALLRRSWAAVMHGDHFERDWRRALEQGIVPHTAIPAAKVTLASLNLPAPEARGQGLYIRLAPDSKTYDGRFANNGWLQESGDPLTKLVWDNAALVSMKDAEAFGISTGDMVRIEAGGQVLNIAAYVLPGQPVGVVTVTVGYGRTASGHVGNGLGFNSYALKTTRAPYGTIGSIQKSGGSHVLALIQDHHLMDEVGARGRDARIGDKGKNGPIIREGTLAELKANPNGFATFGHVVKLQLWDPPHQFNSPHAWGMTIDMSTCIGCNACTIACQAENNIPIVGKTQVLKHREMNWIRIDRYFKGAADDPDIDVVYQPMTCQHCENAPCEQVCPVAATVHDTEGLNTMVYNRCIGTRYCSNNCPYKVRRFNYFDFNANDPREGMFVPPWPGIPDQEQNAEVDPVRKLGYNPEVTVRMRGVMEKCTYCVQRIHAATTTKRAAGEAIVDGDVVTACQQACPTQAIVFGNLNDRGAQVTKLQQNKRAYKVLDELNTRPRTVYLARVTNPAGTDIGPAPAGHGSPAPAGHHG